MIMKRNTSMPMSPGMLFCLFRFPLAWGLRLATRRSLGRLSRMTSPGPTSFCRKMPSPPKRADLMLPLYLRSDLKTEECGREGKNR